MRRLFPLLIIACVVAGTGSAGAASTLLYRWDTQAVLASLNTLGVVEVRVGDSSDRPSIIAKTRDGLNVGVYAKACRPTAAGESADCAGLEGMISYDVSGRADRTALADRLNHQFAAGKYMLEPGGALRLSHYVGLDGGITGDNLTAELRDFFAIGALTTKTLWPETHRP